MIAEETGVQVIGLDISETAVEKARARYPHLHFDVDTVDHLAKYRDREAVLFAEITWYILPQFNSIIETLRRDFRGKYFLHNLVFYKGHQRYRREHFTTLDEFINRVPFELVARFEGALSEVDTIETSTVFRIG